MFSKTLINKLLEAKHVAILSGAGISAESGIKTFRDPDGLWSKFNPQELASADGFMSNPDLVWSWYQYRVDIVNKSEPNPGHFAIAEMQKLFPKCTVITQNVDGLHQRAGAEDVHELHGSIVKNHCFSCKTPFHGKTALPDKQLPKCPECGGKIRPSVVWFGEMLPEDTLRRADEAARICDVFFTVGTSAEVYPAAALPITAAHSGAYVVEVNPNPTAISNSLDECLRAPSGEILPVLIQEIKKQKGL